MAADGGATLLAIVLATASGGLLSVAIAATVTRALLAPLVRHLVSLSAGVLLGAALLNVLPEAFEHAAQGASSASPRGLFLTLLGGLLFFFLLEKAELYRHGHHHEGDHPHHGHDHGFDAQQAGRGGWVVLVGDSIHNFCDGLIVAGAFLVDMRLGVLTSLAIVAHEIPQEVGDYIVLLNAGFSRAKALLFNALSGLAAVAGGVIGYVLLDRSKVLFPYLLVAAASSLIYIAVADLIPQLQQRLGARETALQLGWLALGLVLIAAVGHWLH